jgi:hypothetical protein
MNGKQFRISNHRNRGIPLVLAVLLLTLTAIPALAWDDQAARAEYQPVCCWVSPGDQVAYSDDCLAPEHLPRFPEFITHSQTSAPKVGSEVRVESVVGGTTH